MKVAVTILAFCVTSLLALGLLVVGLVLWRVVKYVAAVAIVAQVQRGNATVSVRVGKGFEVRYQPPSGGASAAPAPDVPQQRSASP